MEVQKAISTTYANTSQSANYRIPDYRLVDNYHKPKVRWNWFFDLRVRDRLLNSLWRLNELKKFEKSATIKLVSIRVAIRQSSPKWFLAELAKRTRKNEKLKLFERTNCFVLDDPLLVTMQTGTTDLHTVPPVTGRPLFVNSRLPNSSKCFCDPFFKPISKFDSSTVIRLKLFGCQNEEASQRRAPNQIQPRKYQLRQSAQVLD